MNDSFISNQVRRMNIRLLLLSLGGVALVLLGAALSFRYLSNLLQGPAEIERATLIATTDARDLDRYYVTITGDDTADTGFSYVSTTDSGSETTDAYYLALLIDDRILLVESNTPDIDLTLTGSLKNVPEEIQTEVIDTLEMEVPEIAGMFLPVMLDNSKFVNRGYLGFAAAGIVGILSLVGISLAGFRMANPDAHPVIKALKRFGEPERLMREIDMEMAMASEKIGKHTNFTANWMVSTKNGIQTLPYRDAIWGYKQVTQHRTNGIPTGKTYSATICDRHGKQTILPGSETEVDEILQNLARHTPGMVIGYSDELNAMWTKEKAQLISAVDQRRSGNL